MVKGKVHTLYYFWGQNPKPIQCHLLHTRLKYPLTNNSQDEKRMSFIYVCCIGSVSKIIIFTLSDGSSVIFIYYHSTRSIFEFGTSVLKFIIAENSKRFCIIVIHDNWTRPVRWRRYHFFRYKLYIEYVTTYQFFEVSLTYTSLIWQTSTIFNSILLLESGFCMFYTWILSSKWFLAN